MKILFVLENYYPHIGGVETLFHSLAQKLSEQNHQVVVLTTLKNDQDLKLESSSNIEIHRKKYLNRYFFTFFAFFAAFRLAKDCDLIHTTSYNAALPAKLAGLLRGKKVIITFHEVWGDLWFKLPFMSKIGARLHYQFEQMLLRLNFHKFIAVSNFTKDALIKQGVEREKVELIYNGIDYSEFSQDNHQPHSDKFIFTFFGRLGMSKGIDLLIEAISLMPDQYRKVIYQLVVPTQPAAFLLAINDLIDQYKVHDKIVLKHNLPFPELKRIIAQSSTVVIPSYSEGFCFAAVETMAIGTPIISSGQGALAEVVSGTFIQTKELNAPALKEAMCQALDDNFQESTLKKFELKNTVENYLSLYSTSMHKA